MAMPDVSLFAGVLDMKLYGMATDAHNKSMRWAEKSPGKDWIELSREPEPDETFDAQGLISKRPKTQEHMDAETKKERRRQIQETFWQGLEQGKSLEEIVREIVSENGKIPD